MLRRIYRHFRAAFLHSAISGSDAALFSQGEGVEVVGLFHNASGLGESARLCAQQLKDEGFKVRCTSVEKYLFKKNEVSWSFDNTASEDNIGCRIIHLNPPMIPPYAIGTGLKKFAKIYNIGYWAWELEKLPREWVKSIHYINSIISPSNFTSSTMRRYTDKPIVTMPHHVHQTAVTEGIRKKIGIKDTDFVVTCIFSLQSSLERKNPQALIKAFLQTFGNADDAYLVFKISRSGKGQQELRKLCHNHKNIIFIDDIWSREDIMGLIKTSNVYASLHRAEGFGLSIAESMLLGTPVVVTNWSGNLDFCHEDNSYLVKYSLVPVQSQHIDFAKAYGSLWAEADVDDAASILKQIQNNPDAAKKKADLCLNETNKYFSSNSYRATFQTIENK